MGIELGQVWRNRDGRRVEVVAMYAHLASVRNIETGRVSHMDVATLERRWTLTNEGR